jgi:hypothetical protein
MLLRSNSIRILQCPLTKLSKKLLSRAVEPAKDFLPYARGYVIASEQVTASSIEWML